MVRTFLGGLVGGVILFVMGYIFWATPLGEIPYAHASDAQNAAVQLALSQNLTQTGTGAYVIPGARSAQGAILYAQGPIATVFFNTQGYSPDDMTMLLPGFIAALIAGLLMAFGLAAVGGGGRSFASVARLVVLFSLGFCVWEYLATPIFNHFGWTYWIYSFVAEAVSLILAGLVIARWFLPSVPETASAMVSKADGPAEPTSERPTQVDLSLDHSEKVVPRSTSNIGAGLGLMIVGGVASGILYIFVNHGYAGSGECYYFGREANFGQTLNCYSGIQYRFAWASALAFLATGAYLVLRSKISGEAK